MSLNLADQYYLKALDGYPYNLEESIENLNYALSYDPEHAGANCLMAKFQMEYLRDYDMAEYFYKLAISSNPENIQVYEEYTALAIKQNDFGKAAKLIRFTHQLKGADRGKLFALEALMCEYQKNYRKSEMLLLQALENSYTHHQTQFLEKELERVRHKIIMRHPYKYEYEE